VSLIAACRCGARFQAPPHLAGRQVACPTCGQALVVPAAAAAPAQAPAATSGPIPVGCRCGQRFAAPPNLAGRQVQCPKCGQAMLVPARPVSATPAQAIPAAPASATAPLAVACRCGQRFAAPPHLAGKQVACPSCRSPIQVPHRQATVTSAPANDDGFWDDLKPPEPTPFQAPGTGFVAPQPSPKKEIPSPAKATSFAIERSARGASSNQIRQELADLGVGPEESLRIVETLHGRDGRAKSSSRGGGGGGGLPDGVGHIGFGCLLFFGGVAVTVGSFLLAEEGGRFVLAFGPVIWGIIHIFVGIGKSLSSG